MDDIISGNMLVTDLFQKSFTGGKKKRKKQSTKTESDSRIKKKKKNLLRKFCQK
mgnify:CR=1 FL=1